MHYDPEEPKAALPSVGSDMFDTLLQRLQCGLPVGELDLPVSFQDSLLRYVSAFVFERIMHIPSNPFESAR